MDNLLKHYRKRTEQSAPPEMAATVISRLVKNQVGLPPLYLILGSSAGLAAAIAFALTFLVSDERAQPPSTASLFGGPGAGIFSVHP